MAQPQASIFHIECPRIGTVRVAVRNSAKSRNFRLWADSPNSAVLSKPYYASVNDALEFARANAEWLSKALEKFSPAIALCEYFEDNPRIFGEEGEIKVWLKPSSLNEFFVQAKGELAIVYKAGDKAGSVERVFKDFARGLVERECARISAETGLGYSRISLRNQNSCWGSRSATGTMSFNWRVALLPYNLRQYVFHHEFAHVKFMDHSTAFWIFLNRLIPCAKRLDSQLSKIGGEIFRVGR